MATIKNTLLTQCILANRGQTLCSSTPGPRIFDSLIQQMLSLIGMRARTTEKVPRVKNWNKVAEKRS